MRAALSAAAVAPPRAAEEQPAQLETAQQELARLQVGCGQYPDTACLICHTCWCGRGCSFRCLSCKVMYGMQAQGLLQQHEAQGESAQLAEARAAAAAAEADRDRAKAQLARCSAESVPVAAQASGMHNIQATTVTTVVL